jgi:hypothetical protein
MYACQAHSAPAGPGRPERHQERARFYANLKEDPDLDPPRKRDDFRKLLSDLEGKK